MQKSSWSVNKEIRQLGHIRLVSIASVHYNLNSMFFYENKNYISCINLLSFRLRQVQVEHLVDYYTTTSN